MDIFNTYKEHKIPLLSLGIVIIGLLWSGINPRDQFTWFLEVAPVFIAMAVLIMTYQNFRFTNLAYGLIALHAIILMIGGHYTYAHVPLFDHIKTMLGTDRNSYDGVGHLAQGFIPAIVIRELLIRTSKLRNKFWIFYLTLFSCLGISATYEIFEWATAVFTGDSAEEFLGTQGDVWDTQKDMLLAGIGSILAQWTLSRPHDSQIKEWNDHQPHC